MKLVRDKIPDIIRSRGDGCNARVCADDAEYIQLLFQKLTEEGGEGAGSISGMKELLLEELGDVVEVVYAIIKLHGWTKADLHRVRKKKLAANGGFEKRLVLEEWWKK